MDSNDPREKQRRLLSVFGVDTRGIRPQELAGLMARNLTTLERLLNATPEDLANAGLGQEVMVKILNAQSVDLAARQTVGKLLAELNVDGVLEWELDALANHGYTTRGSLEVATRDSLKAVGLRLAVTDRLIRVLEASAQKAQKEVIIQYDPPGGPTLKRFKSQEDLNGWLARQKFAGLLAVENGPVVDELERLVPGTSYKPLALTSLRTRVSALELQSRHLRMRREEEFGEAMRQAAVGVEGVSLNDAQLLPDARQLQNSNGESEVEIDAVAIVSTSDGSVAYLGSHKTFTDGTGDVKEAVASRHVAERLAKDPAVVCPPQLKAATAFKVAFMAEAMGPKAAVKVPQYCRQHNVMQLARSHGSIVRIL